MVKHLAIGPGFMGYFALMGALKRLSDDGHLDNLEEMAGASAGGLTSFMYIASKGNFERIMKVSLKIPLKTLMKPNLKTLLNEYGLVPYDKLFKLVSATLSKIIPGRTDITFKELYQHFPIKLYITGFCIDLQRTVYFSVDNEPDMSVIQALCITVCVPILFPPCQYKDWRYIDGAMAETVPCGPFIGRESTLAMGLSYGRVTEVKDFRSYIQLILGSVQRNRFSYADNIPHVHLDMDDFDLFNIGLEDEEKMRMFVHGHTKMLVS